MAGLPEPEASLLAVVFEETSAYQFKKSRDAERAGGGGVPGSGQMKPPGLERGFEEDFTFGEDDPNDYWHFKDTGVDIVD